jgi:hypothetical protein
MIHSGTRSIVQIIPGFSFKTAGSDRAQKFLLRVTTLPFVMIPPLIQWMLKKTTVRRILMRFFSTILGTGLGISDKKIIPQKTE